MKAFSEKHIPGILLINYIILKGGKLKYIKNRRRIGDF